ncbi:MAG: hypothetical protein ACYTF1_08010 [Planctomycetota bacterium]|jgi:ABC-type transport system involved in multi-copper enzyme maturation permease subunit
MKALLWKDLRVNRLVIIAGLVLLLTPYIALVMIKLYEDRLFNISASMSWSQALFFSSWYSLICSCLTIALLGGNIIAGERMDRSAEFLAYLYPSRRMIIGSKILLTLIVFLVILGGNLSVILLALSKSSKQIWAVENTAVMMGTLISTLVIIFGTSWLFSSFMTSPTMATASGIATVIVVAIIVTRITYYIKIESSIDVAVFYSWVAFVLGGLCFISGIIYYLRRVEP